MRIVIPSRGERAALLTQAMESVLEQSVVPQVTVVAPGHVRSTIASGLIARVDWLADPGSLSAAINLGANRNHESYDFLNWLGDDDVLLPLAIERVRCALLDRPEAVAAFGRCRYITPDGGLIGRSRAGRLAPWLMAWGPDLVPQPGMLVRAGAWHAVGGVDEDLHYAMDLDLLLKLRELGPIVSVPFDVACFRWHPDSLTVSGRAASSREARLVKRRFYGPKAKRISWMWEPIVDLASDQAARAVTRRADHLMRQA